ncbi:hypothetical protein [Streptomyces sp. NPDC050504]|uniref:hypothetical protein n=1 Tax=Streptomyces sp. NPDC050504 TaxID=3365618 RepID=UPI0037A317AD
MGSFLDSQLAFNAVIVKTGMLLIAPPARWLAAKLVTAAAVVVAGTAVTVGVYRWAWTTSPDENYPAFWYETAVYFGIGTVTTAYCLFGVATGALAGLLLRRTLPALTAAAAVTAGLTYLMDALRPHLRPTVVTGFGSWRPADGRTTASGGYPPLPHFWPLQLVETGILLALAATATALAFRALHRLHA